MKNVLVTLFVLSLSTSAFAGGQVTVNSPTTGSISVQGQLLNFSVTGTTTTFTPAGDGGSFSTSDGITIDVATLPASVRLQLRSGNVSALVQSLIASYF